MRTKGTILIDFDGTIVSHQYPAIGDPLPDAFRVMKKLKMVGWKLILWTCREDEGHNINKQYLKEAVAFCKENGVEFDAVNEGILEDDFRSNKTPNRKPYAHYHIDDRNLGGFPGWDVVEKALLFGKKVTWNVEEE